MLLSGYVSDILLSARLIESYGLPVCVENGGIPEYGYCCAKDEAQSKEHRRLRNARGNRRVNLMGKSEIGRRKRQRTQICIGISAFLRTAARCHEYAKRLSAHEYECVLSPALRT